MKRDFLTLSTLIREGMQLVAAAPVAIPTQNLNRINTQLTELVKRVKDFLFICSLTIAQKSEGLRRRFFQVQRDSVLVLNELWTHSQQYPDQAFHQLAADHLNDILSAFKDRSPHFFNVKQAIPLAELHALLPDFEKDLLLLSQRLKQHHTHPDLQQLIVRPFTPAVLKKGLSYWQRDYLLNFSQKLLAYVPTDAAPADPNYLLVPLLKIGFNCHQFNQYYKQVVQDALQACYQPLEQLDLLADYTRLFTITSTHPKLRYASDEPLSQRVLLQYVEAEVKNRRQKEAARSKAEVPVQLPAAAVGYRIKTNLSVDGFAYLLRLLIETDAIAAEPRSQLLEFLAAHVQTKGKSTAPISVGSLQVKYKQVTQATALGMRSLLRKMLGQLEEQFRL